MGVLWKKRLKCEIARGMASIEYIKTEVQKGLHAALAKACIAESGRKIIAAILEETLTVTDERGKPRMMALLPGSRIAQMTGMRREHCSRIVKDLVRRNVLRRDDRGWLGIQKNLAKWDADAEDYGGDGPGGEPQDVVSAEDCTSQGKESPPSASGCTSASANPASANGCTGVQRFAQCAKSPNVLITGDISTDQHVDNRVSGSYSIGDVLKRFMSANKQHFSSLNKSTPTTSGSGKEIMSAAGLYLAISNKIDGTGFYQKIGVALGIDIKWPHESTTMQRLRDIAAWADPPTRDEVATALSWLAKKYLPPAAKKRDRQRSRLTDPRNSPAWELEKKILYNRAGQFTKAQPAQKAEGL